MTDSTQPGLTARFKGLPLPGRIACWAILGLLLYSATGFWLVPRVAKLVLEKKLPALLHRPVAIGAIACNPYQLTVTVENFHVSQREGKGDLIAFDRLFVNLEGVSLFKRALIIKALSLRGPHLEFSRLDGRTYSFSDLLNDGREKQVAPPEKSHPFQFAIQNIELTGGQILFHDLPKQSDHTITALNLGIPSLSNLPYQLESYVQPAFSATINGTPFALGGQSKPFAKSLETAMELKATGINIPEYLAYIPNPTGLTLPSALLDIDASLRLLARPDNTYRLALIGRVALRDLAIADQGGATYLRIPELALTLADSDLLAGEVHLREFTLTSPTVNLARLADGTLQPLALLTPAPPPPGGAAAPPANSGTSGPSPGPAVKLDIDRLVLSNGRVDYRDAAAGATLATRLDIDTSLHLLSGPASPARLAVVGQVALRDLALAAATGGKTYLRIPELALSLGEANLLANEVLFSAITVTDPQVHLERSADGRLLPMALLTPAEPQPGNKKTPPRLDTSGKTGPATAPLQLDITKLVLSNGRVDFLDMGAGTTLATRLDIDTSLHLLSGGAGPARLALLGRVALGDLALTGQGGKEYLRIPQLGLVLGDANLLANEVHLREITLTAPSINLERLADGRLLPVVLLTPAEPRPGATEATSPPAQSEDSAPDKDPALKLAIDNLVLNHGRVDFLDAAVGGTGQAEGSPAHLTLRDLDLRVEGLSNVPQALANLTLSGTLNDTGKLKMRGQLGLEPFQSRLQLQGTELALQPLQPYISQEARLVVAGGKLALSGELALTPKPGGGLNNAFQGEAAIADLATVDSLLGEDLVQWRNLELKKINFTSDPGQLSVAAINLVAPYLNVLLNKDGVINLATIRPEPAAPPPPPADTAAPQPFATSIGSISISAGRLDFTDRTVAPAYGTSLSELGGSVSDLSSLATSSAAVEFFGKLDQQAPLKITGRINPLRNDLLVDLKVDFADINLSPMSPYSGKHIGYKIDKGKLNLELQYNIAGRKLDSQNRAFIDQFTLGETVESPEAANLPVRLALALLKDRQGAIRLDVPVSGSLDDPDFSVGRIVLQVLLNLIAKAATSPVALLGALIPTGQDIQFIPFPPGSAELTPEAAATLGTVENVLFERPALKMDLVGRVAQDTDSAALARIQLRNRVKLQKLLAAGKGGKEGALPVDSVELSEAEYPALLALAYQAARKSAPGAKAAEAAPPTHAAMESDLLRGITVDQADLRLLALARANRVLTTLTRAGRVEAGRLFVVEPKVGGTDAAAASQVELVIK